MAPGAVLLVATAMLGLLATARPAAAASFAGYGFRTGVASSSFHGDFDTSVGSESRTAFSGAAYFRYSLGRLFSIQPELGWTSKGDQGEIDFTYVPPSGPPTPVTIGTSFEHQIDYLEIPVLLRIAAPNDSPFEPYLVVGPGVAFRTGSHMELEIQSAGAQPGIRVQPALIFEQVGTFDDPHYRDVDWSMIAGGGLAWGHASFRVIVDTRYALGLVGTFANTDRSFAHNGSWITTLGIELR